MIRQKCRKGLENLQQPILGRNWVRKSYTTNSETCWKGEIKLRQEKAAEQIDLNMSKSASEKKY